MNSDPGSKTPEPDREKLAEQGDQRRQVGMALAAAANCDRVTLGRLAMLKALLDSPDATATIDDATSPQDLAKGFADGGKWRGSVTRSLADDGLAEITGTTRSVRPSRHRGYVSILRLTDRNAAKQYLAAISDAVAALIANDSTPSVAADGVEKMDTQNAERKDLSNDQVK